MPLDDTESEVTTDDEELYQATDDGDSDMSDLESLCSDTTANNTSQRSGLDFTDHVDRDTTRTTTYHNGDGGGGDDEEDNYYFVDEPEISIGTGAATTKRALFVGLSLLLIAVVIVAALFMFWIIPNNVVESIKVKPPYQHKQLALDVVNGTTSCMYGIQYPQTPSSCTPKQNDLIGCQVGCGIVDDCGTCQCGLSIRVSWSNVNYTRDPQYIYLLASLDGIEYWQTGFAQPVLKQSVNRTNGLVSGEATITDGCFGMPFQVINVVACMSSRSITKGRVFPAFPINHCNVTHGICIATNDVALQGTAYIRVSDTHTHTHAHVS
jgi:hypothetical protein